jgi:hypothetical protein
VSETATSEPASSIVERRTKYSLTAIHGLPVKVSNKDTQCASSRASPTPSSNVSIVSSESKGASCSSISMRNTTEATISYCGTRGSMKPI